MGAVYRARDTVLNRDVALKVLSAKTSSDAPQLRARLLREARAAAALDHPNIIHVHDVIEVDGQLCIAMELVEGRSLFDAADGASVEERVRWLVEIARALQAAHDKGIVHRDLKPENVMVRDDGVLKVLDFGIARIAATSTDTADTVETLAKDGKILGTPAFMAPEQLENRSVDGRADQFAWGVMGYELFAGRLPWGETQEIMKLLTAVLTADPKPLAEVAPDVPAHVAAVIDRAMQKAADDRFASMNEAAEALRSGEVPAAAPRTTAAPETAIPGPTRSNGPRALWLVTAVALVAGGAVWWAMTSERGSTPTAPAPTEEPAPARAVTDIPDPQTDDERALEAYRGALRTYRNGGRTTEGFERAIELDPSFAAAHMRLAYRLATWLPEQAREHATAALELRDELGERDRLYAEMLQPFVLAQPRDGQEWLRQARAAVAAFPEDAELHLTLGWALGTTPPHDREQARVHMRRAIELDPRFAWGWQYLYESLSRDRRHDEAVAVLDECIEAIGTASTCRLMRFIRESTSGQCEAALEDIDQILASDPSAVTYLERRALVLAALGRPWPAVHAVLERAARDDGEGAHRAPMMRARLETYRGQFDEALATIGTWEGVVRDASDELRHGEPAALRVAILLELGRTDEAAEAATTYLERRAAFAEDPRSDYFSIAQDVRPVLWQAQLLNGDDAAEDARSAWWQHLADEAPDGAGPWAWLHGEARFADTPERAARAVERRGEITPPEYGPITPFHAYLGRVHLHTGELEAAREHLTLAVGECRRFKWPLVIHQAALDLGRTHEALGDETAACDAYLSVTQHWSPERSVTARAAQERTAALGCLD